MRIVSVQLEVAELEVFDVLHIAEDAKIGKGAGLALDLLLHGVDMIAIDVRVAHRVHKVARL